MSHPCPVFAVAFSLQWTSCHAAASSYKKTLDSVLFYPALRTWRKYKYFCFANNVLHGQMVKKERDMFVIVMLLCLNQAQLFAVQSGSSSLSTSVGCLSKGDLIVFCLHDFRNWFTVKRMSNYCGENVVIGRKTYISEFVFWPLVVYRFLVLECKLLAPHIYLFIESSPL